jgi:ribonuclease Z|tara:strand:- start:507 stop:1355 length:849 start_codon:yes stop_codon:yes gene_type:complete
MIDVTLLGTGSPIPDPHRAGPSTLVQAGDENYLVDAGRGVLMRLAGAGCAPTMLTAVLLTHLHSDHITDLNDVITSSWALNMDNPKPLRIVGPEGTKETVARILHFLDLDIGYRLAHHDDLNEPPQVEVTEITKGSLDLSTTVSISTAPTDHRPVDPTIAFRFDYQESSVVVAGDTVPCTDLDQLCNGAKALVHTAIRKDIIETLPLQRAKDILNYHSSVEEAAQTAQRAGMEMLILTHYVPGIPPAENEFHELVVQQWRDRAAENFSGKVEIGDDLLKISL